MSEPFSSDYWYRVATLKPRLRAHARVHRHEYRGQPWYVLQDTSTGRHHRFSPEAYAVIGPMDGRRTVQAIWEAAAASLGERAPTQVEIIRILAQLHAADLLQSDVPPDSAEILERQQRQRRARWRRQLLSPLAWRFPLFDPERLLARLAPLARPAFTRLAALAWLVTVGTALVLAGMHWEPLTHNIADRVLSAENLFLLWLLYPVVKGLHELGHGLAAKHWGAEVHEAGVMLLVFVPVPYVDASSTWAFPDKARRMAVSAAGIGVELLLAALALLLWLSAEPGLVRTLAYDVMLIGGVSTLLFNGNPLLRFDGYYVLADAIEIPNLAARANRYLGYLMQRYAFGLAEAASPAGTPGERAWFVLYAIASFLYRMAVILFIVLFIAGKSLAAAAALGVWALATQVAWPLARGVHFVLASPSLRDRRVRALAASAALAAVLGALFVVPAPHATRAEGVVWLPEDAAVRAETAGFVRQVRVAPNTPVRAGQVLMACEAPLLEARVRVLEARLAELQARLNALRERDERVQAQVLRDELEAVEASLARERERTRSLLVRSPSDGTFVVPDGRELEGRFVRQGELLGYVVDAAEPAVARVIVPQDDIGLVRNGTRRVQIKLAAQPERTLEARIRHEVPAARERLPSAALGTAGGGPVAVDPSDAQGLTALEPVFQLDLALPEGARIPRKGGRVYVRFEHGDEPLAQQWLRRGRQLFLSRIDA